MPDANERPLSISRLGKTISLTEINLNQSRLQVYRDCPRKFYWKFVENLDTDRPAINLEVGSGTHEGLAELGAGRPLEEAIEAAVARYRRDLPKRRLPGDDELYADGEETVRRLLTAYEDHWGREGQKWHPLGNEVAGKVEVGEGTGVFLTFRSDKFVQWHGGLWIVDHKTAAKMDPREMMKYQMNIQVTAYIYGAMKLLQTRIQGVIVDFLVKTKIPQFAREVFERTDEELNAFEVEFVRWARQIQRDTIDASEMAGDAEPIAVNLANNLTGLFHIEGRPWLAFPKNDKECFRFGTCSFRSLCMDPSNTGLREQFVLRKEDYVDDAALLSAGEIAGHSGL